MPVYNGAPYLEESIKSVLGQTYRNLDLTVLDNCSTDGSAAIAERLAAQDARVTVRRSEQFITQYANLNAALASASPDSKYIKVVFADDAIYPSCLAEMVAVAEQDEAIGVVSAYEANEVGINCQGLPREVTAIQGKDALRACLLQNNLLLGSMNTILLRADIVRRKSSFFRLDNPYFEDLDRMFAVLLDVKLGFVHQILTFTRRANISTISGIATYHPWLLTKLILLEKYGRQVLDKREFERCLRAGQREYFDMLGEALLRRPRDAKFWEFHRDGLKSIGYTLRSAPLFWHAGGACLDLVLNPKSTFERLWARLRRSSLEKPAIA
jgi:glycosyltransferase involved in cell wall biosynthesis